MYALDVIGKNGGRGWFTLTRPRSRVISSTKWEVNMTRKYRIASSAIVPKRLGILSFFASDFEAKKTINVKARKSSKVYITGRGQLKYAPSGSNPG